MLFVIVVRALLVGELGPVRGLALQHPTPPVELLRLLGVLLARPGPFRSFHSLLELGDLVHLPLATGLSAAECSPSESAGPLCRGVAR